MRMPRKIIFFIPIQGLYLNIFLKFYLNYIIMNKIPIKLNNEITNNSNCKYIFEGGVF